VPSGRPQSPLHTEPEHWSARLAFAALLLALLVAFWIFTRQFRTPAHGGADQNAYLVAGKQIAGHLTPALRPDDPHAFVGRMWVAAPDGRYFPKYPLGLPLIVAGVWKVAGPTAVYFISPAAMLLGLTAVFLLARRVAGSFAGLLAVLIVAASPVTLGLANNPNSHAAALCAATWGTYFLLGWWQSGGLARAALAGLLIGLAATIRYSEALLGLPLILVALFNLRPGDGRSRAEAFALLTAWAAPILLLLSVNRLTMGTWTGYDATHESTGFAIRHLARHWDVVIRQLAGTGLFLTFPVGVTGLILLFARNGRLAAVLWAWVLPPVLLYGSYYWAPENLGLAYARFFLTVFPPLALGAAWCLSGLAPAGPHSPRAFRVVAAVAALVLVLGAGAYNVRASLPMLAADDRSAQAVARAAEQVMAQAKAPPGSVLFGPREMLHHLQFVGDYRLYAGEEFDRRYVASLSAADPDEPTPLQPERAAALRELFGNKTDAELAALLRTLAADHLAHGRRVLAIGPAEGEPPLRFTDATFDAADGRSFTTRTLSTWSEPEPLPRANRRRGIA
jgi:hypothetical protein